ncbi:bacterial proteasome activator family protein [Mariniluteicoccus flavus]
MTEENQTQPEQDANQAQPTIVGQAEDGRTYVVGPRSMAVEDRGGNPVGSMVEEPAKVMRIGHMTRTLLEEIKSAPLDDASRKRLREVYAASVAELKDGLDPELAAELERIAQPFAEDATPSDAELRIAQAQLVGWLEGLFQGIQTALVAQQMAARAQLEQMHRALPPGHPQAQGPDQQQRPDGEGGRSGMYL